MMAQGWIAEVMAKLDALHLAVRSLAVACGGTRSDLVKRFDEEWRAAPSNRTQPPTCAPDARYFVYEVKFGDTLSDLAERFGVRPSDAWGSAVTRLAWLNRLPDPGHIEAGWLLIIPKGEGEP